MDGGQAIIGMGRGLHHGGTGGLQLSADPLGTLGHLRPGRADTEVDLAAGLVVAMGVAPDDWDREGHGRAGHTTVGPCHPGSRPALLLHRDS